jgi:predicted deacetylase
LFWLISSMMRSPLALIVSLHDAHPGSLKQVGAQRSLLEDWGVHKTSILVVPEFHHGKSMQQDDDFLQWARAWAEYGDEMVLHGFYHDRKGQRATLGNYFLTRLYTNNEAEFLDLPREEALNRLRSGQALFAWNNWPIRGFIAPCWLMSKELPALLWEEGFSYTNTLHGVLHRQRGFFPGRSLCWSTRTGWRVNTSLIYNRWLFGRLLGQPVLRISLHPMDFEFPRIRRQVEKMIKSALQRGYEPTSYAEYVSAR